MQLTYYFDVCSMWCALADEALDQVAAEFGSRVPLEWKVALINGGAPIEAGPEQEAWYYDRCEAVTGRRFNHRWLEAKGLSTLWPGRAIVAAWQIGKGREVHAALRDAAMREGRPIPRPEVAVRIAAAAAGADERPFRARMESAQTEETLRNAGREFDSYRIDQRPAFVVRSEIGDAAVLSGIYRFEPLKACLEAMIRDEDRYRRHAASHPPIPA